MGLFLQILLAVFVVIVGLLLFAYLMFRLWLRRTTAHFNQVHELLDEPHRPARLELWNDERDDYSAPFQEAWAKWHKLGFRKLGDFASESADCSLLRLAAHHDNQLGLVLCQDENDEIHTVVIGITEGRHLHASSNRLGESLRTRVLNWMVDAGLNPRAQVDQVLEATANESLLPPTSRLLRSAFEQVWARLADAELAKGPPSRQNIESLIRQKSADFKPALVDEVHEQAVRNWRFRLHDAVLDNYKRTSRIEASQWQRLQDRITIIDDRMEAGDIRASLDADAYSERLLEQFSRQGLSGIDLFEAIQARMPAARRLGCLAKVNKPVAACIYSLEEGDADTSRVGAQAYFFEAVDESGQRVEDMVLAMDRRDAHSQIQDMGLSEIRLVAEPNPGEKPTEDQLDRKLAMIAVRSLREPLAVSLLRSLFSSSWIWLPPLVLIAWSLKSGPPFSWVDWLIFVYAGLAGLVVLIFVGPMLLYHQLQLASIKGRYRAATIYLNLIRLTGRVLPLPAGTLELEHCKLLAARRLSDQALARWRLQESVLEPEAWFSGLGQIHDSGGNFPAMIEAQRRHLAISSNKDLPKIDLALSLVRFERNADEAESLLAGLDLDSLSGLVLSGYHYVRGLILAERDQHAAALNQYRQAVDQSRSFRHIPIASLMIGEINGYAALSLRASGERQQAEDLWQSVWPLIAMSTSSQFLIQRWQGRAAHQSTE